MLITKPSLRSLLFLLHHLPAYYYTETYELFIKAGETWVTIGGDPSAIRANAAHDRYHGAIQRSLRRRPEFQRGPVWSGEGKDYLAYGVDNCKVREAAGEVSESWVHSPFDDEEEFLDPSDLSRVHPGLADKIKRKLRLARDLVEFLDRRGGSVDNVVDRIYSGEDLLFADGVDQVRRELYRARRVMDERLAAINFALCRAEPDVETYVRQVYGAYITKWHLLDDMRGICIDFRTFDPNVTHVLDYLRREVPVYYPVDIEFCPELTEAEARLADTVKTADDFAFALLEAFVSPRIRKTDIAPRRLFGTAIDTHVTPQLPRVSRLERYDDLDRVARVVLTDVLHPNLAPVLHPFEEAPPLLIVGDARLILDPLTELRMMCWAAKYRATNVCEVLGEALLRGWYFRVAYSKERLDELAQQAASNASVPPDRVPHFVVTVNFNSFDVPREWVKYVRRALALLSRYNSYVFLHLGGIFWRLALLIGHGYLSSWKENLLGPSSALAIRRDVPPVMPGYWADPISEVDKKVLLGLCVSSTDGEEPFWFPSQDLLLKHRFHDGEWSATEEAYLMERYRSLERGEDRYRPLSNEEWEAELAAYKPGRLLRDSFVLVHSPAADALLEEARYEFRGSWNLATMGEVTRSLETDSEEGEE
ncbi:hypothetical protein BC629DRAFT_1598418 [Irpex lacteus]|nr:hypothetical protein BC629DRAFT_1598418 [Irpex lacteus]